MTAILLMMIGIMMTIGGDNPNRMHTNYVDNIEDLD